MRAGVLLAVAVGIALAACAGRDPHRAPLSNRRTRKATAP